MHAFIIRQDIIKEVIHDMKRLGHLLVALLLSALVSACSAFKTNSPRWNTFSLAQFRQEVEVNSKPDQVWNYSGSDSTYHYFFRDSGRMFIGRRFCCKIRKSEFSLISVTEEQPYTGALVSYSFAF